MGCTLRLSFCLPDSGSLLDVFFLLTGRRFIMLVFAGDVDGISVFSDDPMDSAICGVIFSPRVLG